MAERLLTQPYAYQPGVTLIQGSFVTAGTSAPTGAKGRGYSVAYTTTGTYTITLTDTYNALLSAIVTYQNGTATDQFVQVGSVDLSARTIVIRVWDISGGAASDVTGPTINFELYLKDSSTIQ